MLVMIDLGIGNVQSVQLAFERVGARTKLTSDPADVEEANGVILPGVGAFGDGMKAMATLGLVEPLRRHVASKRPLFGICLGMQLLADESEEHGHHEGLGMIKGRVIRLSSTQPGARIPNMGWCDVRSTKGDRISKSDRTESFYFAHSYHLRCDDTGDVAGVIDYGGQDVVAAISRDNVFGVQFHPEKSQHAGLDLLSQYCRRHGFGTGG
jgi:imidazole glycerol-phosphate synthase subunit HisH